VARTHHRRTLPRSLAWLFPEADPSAIEVDRDARYVLARVLEFGRMRDVAWCVRHYGYDRIHTFFRSEGDPSLTPKTVALWRLVLDARDESWAQSRRSRLRKLAPWPG
jgi:hypothetical protein